MGTEEQRNSGHRGTEEQWAQRNSMVTEEQWAQRNSMGIEEQWAQRTSRHKGPVGTEEQ